MKYRVMFFLLSLAGAVAAHEGHDHGDAPQPEAGTIAPRFEARSDVFDVVGVLRDGEFHVFVDQSASNQPVTQAAIEIESGTHKLAVKVSSAGPDGAFRLPAGALASPGDYPLTLTIEAGDAADLLTARFNHIAASEAHAPGKTNKSDAKLGGSLFYVAISASLLAGLAAWWLLGRRA